MSLKDLVKPFVPKAIMDLRHKQLREKALQEWEKNGKPVPPPHIVKQLAIAEYQKRSGYTTLVETGTYLGDMVEAQRSNFKKVFSIELQQDLFEKAKKRFIHDPRITIVLGDSGEMLPSVMKEITEPTIFWLDGHYSAGITAKGKTDCPIFQELRAILTKEEKPRHILLIDDARCFNGAGDYPTIADLSAFLDTFNMGYKVDVKDDIIRCTN